MLILYFKNTFLNFVLFKRTLVASTRHIWIYSFNVIASGTVGRLRTFAVLL